MVSPFDRYSTAEGLPPYGNYQTQVCVAQVGKPTFVICNTIEYQFSPALRLPRHGAATTAHAWLRPLARVTALTITHWNIPSSSNGLTDRHLLSGPFPKTQVPNLAHGQNGPPIRTTSQNRTGPPIADQSHAYPWARALKIFLAS